MWGHVTRPSCGGHRTSTTANAPRSVKCQRSVLWVPVSSFVCLSPPCVYNKRDVYVAVSCKQTHLPYLHKPRGSSHIKRGYAEAFGHEVWISGQHHRQLITYYGRSTARRSSSFYGLMTIEVPAAPRSIGARSCVGSDDQFSTISY